ncbi:MAG: hypothetical protein ACOC3W_02790 [Thermodesulfobacteriota bacterium]
MMAASKKPYRRLPGKKAQLVGFHTLWAGKDHLLHIHSQQVREEYKRYYYKDIQAVYIRKTARMKIESLILMAVTAGFLLLAWFDFAPIWTYSLAGIMGAGLLVNLFRGPTCECHIQTFVRREKLPSLYRIRTARKALEILKPLIHETQGRVTSTMLEDAGEKGLPREPPALESNPLPDPAPAGKSRIHPILFSLLLASGLAAAADISFQHVALPLVWVGTISGAVVCVIIALVKQFEVKTAKGIQTLTWISLVFLCMELVMGYGLYMYVLFTHLDTAYNQWEAFLVFSALSPAEKPIIFVAFGFSAAGGLLLGVIGLFLILRADSRRKADRPRPSPALEPAAASDS